MKKLKNIIDTFQNLRINFKVENDDLKEMFNIEDKAEPYLLIKKLNKTDEWYINSLLEQSKKLINKYISVIL